MALTTQEWAKQKLEQLSAIRLPASVEKETCPRCGKKKIETSSRLGRRFLGCPDYPRCRGRITRREVGIRLRAAENMKFSRPGFINARAIENENYAGSFYPTRNTGLDRGHGRVDFQKLPTATKVKLARQLAR